MSDPTAGGPGRPNHLAGQTSPYLLQHAGNPVDWYPWGSDAFEKAKREDKPVFLSIGYSTCHWCHVMEDESFEDPIVAALMNEAFVNVKVDREERPDIDQVYMTVCQMLTGSGGWPLTIIMTPDKRPFFAATYIPKNARYGRAGMTDLIPQIREIWQTRRSDILETAEKITGHLQNAATGGGAGSKEVIDSSSGLPITARAIAARLRSGRPASPGAAARLARNFQEASTSSPRNQAG